MVDSVRPDEGKIRVFLLDDHEIVRRGIKELLESEGDIVVVGESGLGRGGGPSDPGAAAGRRHPRRAAARTARASTSAARSARSTPTIKALILTSYDDDEALFAAIMAGAAGYILKQVRGNDLVDTVRRVAAGQSMLDPAVTAQVLDRLRNGPPRGQGAGAAHRRRSSKILELIGEGLTNRQIAEQMFLAEKTVKNYVSSLLAKLGLERGPRPRSSPPSTRRS